MLNNELIEAGHEKFLFYWRELAVFGVPLPAMEDELTPLRRNQVSGLNELAKKEFDLDFEGREIDCSFLLIEDGEPLLGCRLSLSVLDNGKTRLGCSGYEATTYLNSRAIDSQTQNLTQLLLAKITEHLNHLIQTLQPDVIELRDSLDFGLLSPVSQYLIVKGGLPRVSHSTVIDLLKPERTLLRDVKKSVRCHIQQAQREYEFLFGGSAAADFSSSDEQLRKNTENHAQQLKRLGFEGAKAEKFFVGHLAKHGLRLATVVFSYQGSALKLRRIACLKDLPNKQLLYALLWQAGGQARAAGCSQLILGHELQCVEDELLSYSCLGGNARSEITVTLENT